MKKVYLGLAISTLLAGAVQASNLVVDPQLTEFRANKGNSKVWVQVEDNKAGKGDVGSSKDSAFDTEGSARMRFRNADDDFSAQPALEQTITGLKPNTDYVMSFYLMDKKGQDSISDVIAGARGADGKALGEKAIHVRDLADAPKGTLKSSFRQAMVDFNSGNNTTATIFTRLHITDASKIAKGGDIGKQTEVRVDSFSVTEK